MPARPWLRRLGIACAIAAGIVLGLPWLRVALDDDTPSHSSGRRGRGRLEHGHVFAPVGVGHQAYSMLGAGLGRQYAHHAVRDTLTEAFAVRRAAGAARYVLGETGLRGGGRMRPHRTHQNGMSVDVFMPVRDAGNQPSSLPTWPWHGFGYRWEFDRAGSAPPYHIDFVELAELLRATEARAAAHGLELERVIIAPEYVPLVLATAPGKRLGAIASRLTRRPVWVRHDEHVHLDFRSSTSARVNDGNDDDEDEAP